MATLPATETERLSAFPASGYYVFRQECGTLIADFSAPGDEPNPGHRHAGIFSYEISSGRQRIVVDTGTPTYDPGPERQSIRGTESHNTVRLEGKDQFEVWRSFRVGATASVDSVRFGGPSGDEFVVGSHDGYRGLGATHRRSIVALGNEGWLVVDEITGAEGLTAESFVHLHPGIRPTVEHRAVRLHPTDWTLTVVEGPDPQIEDSAYSERLGERQKAKRLAIRGAVSARGHWAYAITHNAKNVEFQVDEILSRLTPLALNL